MNTIILKVKGKNISNFILRLHHNHINIYKIEFLNKDLIRIEILDKDYEKVIKIKTIYKINIEQYRGFNKIKDNIKYNKYILISILFGIMVFTILTNIIFDVEISYSGNNMRNYISKELEKYGIKKYCFIKSFSEIQDIKKKVLDENKEVLEWIEIERVGTKYIVKIEPRKINKKQDDDKIYNIVASRDATIKSIEAYSGEILKSINSYVKKGDVIISSNITLNDEVKNIVSAKGVIYGEVWYQIEISYPLSYYEEKETGNIGYYYNIGILNKNLNFSKIKNMKQEDKIILKSDLLPLYFSKQKQIEIEIIDYNLSIEEAIEKAKIEGRKKINNILDKNEYIIDEKSLKIDAKDSKIVLDMFYTVYKDITEYVEIEG